MHILFLYSGLIFLSWATIQTLFIFEKKTLNKFWKKHLKKRKKYFSIFLVFILLLGWGNLEEAFSQTTNTILWGAHVFLFAVFIAWSGKKIFDDYRRIEGAKKRREKKES